MKPKLKINQVPDVCGALFLYGLDVITRTIYVDGMINEQASATFIRSLRLLEQLSDEPIHVAVSSYGGSVHDGLAIYDAMIASSCKIVTQGIGKVMSMGLIVFLAGEDRIITPSTTLMVHQMQSMMGGNMSAMQVEMKENERLHAMLLSILAGRTGQKASYWESIKENKYLGAREALKLGIVTKLC